MRILALGSKYIDLHHGDMRKAVRGLPEASVDSVVTDPPYHLSSIVKRFAKTDHSDNTKTSERVRNRADGYARAASGFMGKQWDGGDIAFRPETWELVLRVLKPGGHMVAFGAPKNAHRLTCAIEDAGFEIRDMVMWVFGQGFPKSKNAGNGWGTALKPAYEPIILARKPIIGTVAANVLAYGTGAINVDGCRVEGSWERNSMTRSDIRGGAFVQGKSGGLECAPQAAHPSGRWPANLIHDGSEEVLAAFPDGKGQAGPEIRNRKTPKTDSIYGQFGEPSRDGVPHDEPGSAARFFYSAKADANDRLGSKHPTVKPVDLIRYLVRLITPPGGVVLDPFSGTGTTGEAAFLEGMSAILVEREAESIADIKRRASLILLGPDERKRELAKQSNVEVDNGPLFEGICKTVKV